MPLLSRDQIIEQYYQEVKEKYPHITYEQCQEICKLPFDGIVQWIKSGLFPHVMIKHFGKILVSEKRLRGRLNQTIKAYKEGRITEEAYLKWKPILEDHLKSLEQITNREVKRQRKEQSKHIIVIDDIQTSNQADNQG